LPDAVRVVIELDAEVPFRQERIPDPSRVFLDLPGTRPVTSLLDQTIRFQSDADVVRQVRLGRHPNNTTRVVLDAAGVSSYSVYPLYDPYRLVIDCVRASGASAVRRIGRAGHSPSEPAVRQDTGSGGRST
jgi:N-acetylmuramoyl-L-alanine amidase